MARPGPRRQIVAFWIVVATWLGCSGEQYEKPQEESPVALAPEPAAEPSPVAIVEAPAPVEEAPAPEEPIVAEAEEAEEAPAEDEATAPPAAPADLALLGVVRGAAGPSALIEYRGSQEIFRRGDTVFDLGAVKQIGADKVVIAGEEGEVTLTLASGPAVVAPPAAPDLEVVERAPPGAVEPPPPPIAQAIPRAEARAALQGFSRVLAESGAEGVAIGGGRGIRLAQVEPKSFLGKLGLKSGDVLQKIDDLTLSDPRRLPDLSTAANGRELTVMFVRDEIGLTISRRLK